MNGWILGGAYILAGLTTARWITDAFVHSEMGGDDDLAWVFGSIIGLMFAVVWPLVVVVALFYRYVIQPLRRSEHEHEVEP